MPMQKREGAIVLVFIVAGAFVCLTFLGTQTSAILSKVGASVGGYGTTVSQGNVNGGGSAPAPKAAVPANAGTSSAAAAAVHLDVSRPDLLVVKTGTLQLQVEKLDDAVAVASDRIVALGGYASGSERSADGRQTASVTYRIPAAAWDQALVELRAVATRVVAEKTQTEDVTGQVVDLSARIANLQATEKAFAEIMAKATKIADVLEVQGQLTKVRGEIEQATAERDHLRERAAFSTLTVTFALRPEPAVVASQKSFDPQDEVDRAAARLLDVAQRALTVGIWFAIVWLPVFAGLSIVGVALALVAFGLALVVRRVRARLVVGSA